MSQRFGDFFYDPEWPANAHEAFLSFYDLALDLQSDLILCKIEPEEVQQQIPQIQVIETPIIQDESMMVKQQEPSEVVEERVMPECPSTQRQDQIARRACRRCRCLCTKERGRKRIKHTSINPLRNHKKIKKNEYQRGKYKILTQQVKKRIVQQSKIMTMVQVSRKYHVSVNNICRWRKRCDRRSGAGRKVTDMEMECKLLNWLLKQKNPISRKQVQLMAKKMSSTKDFKASKGWFERFYKRNKLDFNTNIQILTHNDYRQRISQNPDLRAMTECKQEQNHESLTHTIERIKLEE